jgi:hypothetical protein
MATLLQTPGEAGPHPAAAHDHDVHALSLVNPAVATL